MVGFLHGEVTLLPTALIHHRRHQAAPQQLARERGVVKTNAGNSNSDLLQRPAESRQVLVAYIHAVSVLQSVLKLGAHLLLGVEAKRVGCSLNPPGVPA